MGEETPGKRGAVSKAEQIQRLKAKMTPGDVAAAEEMARDPRQADIIRLAFKLLEPAGSSTAATLTKVQQTTYEELKAISPRIADTWKKRKLAERQLAPRPQRSNLNQA